VEASVNETTAPFTEEVNPAWHCAFALEEKVNADTMERQQLRKNNFVFIWVLFYEYKFTSSIRERLNENTKPLTRSIYPNSTANLFVPIQS
jgi:hypothetical protein